MMKAREFSTKVESVEKLDEEEVGMEFEVQKEDYLVLKVDCGRCLTFGIFKTCESVQSLSIPALELVNLYETRWKLIFPVIDMKFGRGYMYDYTIDLPVKLVRYLSDRFSFKTIYFRKQAFGRISKDGLWSPVQKVGKLVPKYYFLEPLGCLENQEV